MDSLSSLPLNKATVAIVNATDSTLVAFTLTEQSGTFSLHNLPSGVQLRLIISYVSYLNHRQILSLPKGGSLDVGAIAMQKRTHDLEEVVIKGERPPVVINRDTIEFSAEAFKVRPNAVVEELLNKLPGLQVNSDGSILVNGKGISKILVNGHEYFSNDPRIASKNLDAAMIDKVQIYNDRDNDPDSLLDESKIRKVINLKFKKKYKKSFFGKMYAGGGTDDRYETGALLNSLRDTLQVSLIGYSNNLSHTAFSRDDLSALGGFNRSGLDQVNNGNIATGGKIYDGIEQVSSMGVNINDDYGKKLKINFLFFLNHTIDTYKKSSLSTNFLNDTTLSLNQINNKKQIQTSYNFSSLVQWNPSASEQIKYSPHLLLNTMNTDNEIFSDQYNNFNQHVNTEIDTIHTKNHPNQFDQQLIYYKKFNDKGESLTVTHKLIAATATVNNYLNNNLINYVQDAGIDTLHQLNTTITNNFSISTDASFRYPLSKKLSIILIYNNIYSDTKQNTVASGYDSSLATYNSVIPDQSANIQRTNLTQTIRPGIYYKFAKATSFSFDLGAQWQDIGNTIDGQRHFSERYFYLLPSLTMQGAKYSINYNQSITQPTISDLNPAIIKVNSYYSFIGNPYLTPGRLHSLTASYYLFNIPKNYNLLVYAVGTLKENNLYNNVFFSPLGTQVATPVNGFNTHSAFIGVNFMKQFSSPNNWKWSMRSSINPGMAESIVSVNKNNASLNYYYSMAYLEFQLNYKDVVEFTPHYEISPSYSEYGTNTYPSTYNFNQKFTMKYWVRFSNAFFLEGDFTHFHDSQLSPDFQRSNNLLNSAFAFQFGKHKTSQLKVTAFDILNQNISIYRTVAGNGIYQGENLIQRRYLMLSYQFKFTKGNGSSSN